jgi:hypothetical protein
MSEPCQADVLSFPQDRPVLEAMPLRPPAARGSGHLGVLRVRLPRYPVTVLARLAGQAHQLAHKP